MSFKFKEENSLERRNSNPEKKFPEGLAEHLAVCAECRHYKKELIRKIEEEIRLR